MTDPKTITNTPGTYLLLLELTECADIRIGRSKQRAFVFQPGWYAYVGSALGAGGLRSRLRRHASHNLQRKHWHIDYFSERAELYGALVLENRERVECVWSRWIAKRAEACIEGFGASDCRCRGHLYRLAGFLARNELIEVACRELQARFCPVGQFR